MTIAPCDYDSPASLIFLSGSITPGLRLQAHRDDLGVLVQPGTREYVNEVRDFGRGLWGADNGCFAELKPNAKPFDAEAWFAWVQTLPTDGLLFVNVPDVVGDHAATVARSAEWLPRVRALGLPAGFVVQNGATVDNIPWDSFDCLFVGGSKECECGYVQPVGERGSSCPTCGGELVEWKDKDIVLDLIAEAHARGLWAHVGRVNTAERFAHFVGHADSCDGTILCFGEGENLARVISWLQPCECVAHPSLAELRATARLARQAGNAKRAARRAQEATV